MSKLTIDDISDLRAYEREREEFRTHVIALKKRRRVSFGPVTTFVFENRETIRFQIQEMARIEKLISDEAIESDRSVVFDQAENRMFAQQAVLSLVIGDAAT